jgi:hypothetical protein
MWKKSSWKGSVIADIKEEKEKFCEKTPWYSKAPWKPISHLKEISYQKLWDNNKFWPRSHHKGISYRIAWDNNKLWLRSQNKGIFYHLSGNNKRLWPWLFQRFALKFFVRIFMQYQLIFFSCNGKIHEKIHEIMFMKECFVSWKCHSTG